MAALCSAASLPLDSEPPKKKPKREKNQDSDGEKDEESHVPGGEKDEDSDRETDLEPDGYGICDEYVSESDGEGLTSEEMAEYSRRVDASGGFDVPDFPNALPAYRIAPFDQDPQLMDEHSLLAIKDFNAKNNLNYEFVKVVRSNARVVNGFEFYITFEAKKAGGDEIQIFEAQTWTCSNRHEVDFCRMKVHPTPSS